MWGIFYPKKGNILYFSKRGKVPFTGSKNSLDKSLPIVLPFVLGGVTFKSACKYHAHDTGKCG